MEYFLFILCVTTVVIITIHQHDAWHSNKTALET